MLAAFLLSAAGAVAFGIWKLGLPLVALGDEVDLFCDADTEEPLPCARDMQLAKAELPISA
jgi:hypothetical protein